MGITDKGVSSFQLRVASARPANGSVRLASFVFPFFARNRRVSAARRGVWMVLLGPDGAGKSSVIAGIGDGVAAGFAGCDTYHLRPALFSQTRTPTTNCDPHAKSARGTLVTTAKLAYLLAANCVG